MEKEKRVLMLAEQQMDVIIKISDKIPSHLQSEFRRISELNDSMLDIYKPKKEKSYKQ